ncbi:MAG: NAD(+)/NADH kinase [Anaerolineales bacterium]
MSLVGIIANPSSGKDIRRLVAHAVVAGNREKVSLLRRMLVGLHAAEVADVQIMPDRFGLGRQAIHELGRTQPEVVKAVRLLEMSCAGNRSDSLRAASILRELGAGCILTLGGDGTVGAVAKGSGDVPILAVSMGTNNVVPQFIEGTIAGLAAGIVARQGWKEEDGWCYRAKRIEVSVNGQVVNNALVDVAAVAGSHVGTRAVWEPDTLRQIVVTRASPSSIGLSAIIASMHIISEEDAFGAVARVGGDGPVTDVLTALAPGLVAHVRIAELTLLPPDRPWPVVPERPLLLALDGERDIGLFPDDQAFFTLRTGGPRIVRAERVMEEAARRHLFVSQGAAPRDLA